MRLRKPCAHGVYDDHQACPGGEFLADDALFERLQDQLEDIYHLRLLKLGVHKRGLCQSFAAEAVETLKDLVRSPDELGIRQL